MFANSDTLLDDKVKIILKNNTEESLRCILFDSAETKSLISNMISYQSLVDANYFLFDYLDSLTASITKNIPIECTAILRSDNINMIIQELSSPHFSSYRILFCDQINKYLLEALANGDSYGLVKSVWTICLGGWKIDSFFYEIANPKYLHDDLKSLSMSVEHNFKYYFFQQTKNINNDSHESMSHSNTDHNHSNVDVDLFDARTSSQFTDFCNCLVIPDRSYDTVTTNLPVFTYQALVYKKIGLSSTNSCMFKEKLYTMKNDWFYEKHKFLDIKTVGFSLKELGKKIAQASSSSILDDEIIPEKRSDHLYSIYEKHLQIYTYLMDDLIENEKEYTRIFERLRKTNKKDSLIEFNKKSPLLLSYIPPIRRIVKNFVQNKLKNIKCYDQADSSKSKNKNNKKLFFVIANKGATYTEYMHIQQLAKDLKVSIFLITDKLLK